MSGHSAQHSTRIIIIVSFVMMSVSHVLFFFPLPKAQFLQLSYTNCPGRVCSSRVNSSCKFCNFWISEPLRHRPDLCNNINHNCQCHHRRSFPSDDSSLALLKGKPTFYFIFMNHESSETLIHSRPSFSMILIKLYNQALISEPSPSSR